MAKEEIAPVLHLRDGKSEIIYFFHHNLTYTGKMCDTIIRKDMFIPGLQPSFKILKSETTKSQIVVKSKKIWEF